MNNFIILLIMLIMIVVIISFEKEVNAGFLNQYKDEHGREYEKVRCSNGSMLSSCRKYRR